MRRGFTLLELSIVLTLIAVILGGGMVTFNASLQAKEFNTTVARMDAIDKAILNFSVAYGRIPCPSDNTQTVSSTTYGIEAATPGTCYGGTPAANYAPSSGSSAVPVEGGVPTRTLKLTDDYMYDGWGRKFGYAVDPYYTTNGTLPPQASCTTFTSSTGFTVYDPTVTAANARTTAATYALISHGANGHGAYTSAGGTTVINSGSTNANEITNCHCNAGAVNSYSTPSYVAMAPTVDYTTTTTTDNFDDIVTFKEAWQLQAPNSQIASSSCPIIYVADTSNNRVVEISGGSYVSQLAVPGCTGTGACTYSSQNGQYNGPMDVEIDLNGNFWVSDPGGNRVEKLNSSATWVSQIGCTTGSCTGGTGTNLLKNPTFITIDSNGNLWITDGNNYSVDEYSSSGSYILSLGAGYNGVTGTQGTAGTAAGQFKQPGRVAVNVAGNMVYVPDQTNNNVQTFNMTTGAYIGQLGGCGSGSCTQSSSAGQYYGPNSVRIDSSGYIWVLEYSNNRIQKLNTSGTQVYPYQIGCAVTTPGTGQQCNLGGNGQFSQSPHDFAFDAYGHIWVTGNANTAALYEYGTTGEWLGSYSSAGSTSWGYPEGIAIPSSSR